MNDYKFAINARAKLHIIYEPAKKTRKNNFFFIKTTQKANVFFINMQIKKGRRSTGFSLARVIIIRYWVRLWPVITHELHVVNKRGIGGNRGKEPF
jgi:hypothetical protein